MSAIIPTILILAMVFFAISMQRRKSTDKIPPRQRRGAMFAAIALAAIGAAYYFLRPLLH